MNAHSEMLEIESIKQLKARYCRYLDTKDWSRGAPSSPTTS
jgi:hypothetical protein